MGGGKIYLKLLSSLIHILFMMYFYQQYFAIQLPLLNVTYLNKKCNYIFKSDISTESSIWITKCCLYSSFPMTGGEVYEVQSTL